jgi:hypothetical protein
MIEACGSRRNVQDSDYVSSRFSGYRLERVLANILVGARTRLATPFGRGGPVQPLSRGECFFFARVYR